MSLTFTSQAPLDKKVYWRIGGTAEFFVEIDTLDQLLELQASGDPITWLGNGSNVLVHDDGISGVVARLGGELATILPEDSGTTSLESDCIRLRVGAGIRLSVLQSRADKKGWGGAELFAGVPGTLGGAIAMNAGTHLGETQELVEEVTLVTRSAKSRSAEVRVLPASALRFSYRSAALPEGAAIASALLRFRPQQDPACTQAREEHLAYRKATQPLDLPSCGSTFTNPKGDKAGRLIEAAGLKGLQRGHAQISSKHANFIVNLGGARAEDVRWLIASARVGVHERFGIWLEPEVRLLGPWPADALEKP